MELEPQARLTHLHSTGSQQLQQPKNVNRASPLDPGCIAET
jgi:hypothetical protein